MGSNLMVLLIVAGASAVWAKPAHKKAPPAPTSAASVRGPTRIDICSDQVITGQLNRAGGVYLYERKELKVRSMVKPRDNFRAEIIGSIQES